MILWLWQTKSKFPQGKNSEMNTKFPYITHGYKNKKIFQDLTGEKTSGTDLTAADSRLRTHTTEPLVLSGSYLTKDKYKNTASIWIEG